MKHFLLTILLLMNLSFFGQKNPTEEAQPIVDEGKMLYKSEMASWYGTDLFLEKYKDVDKIGGYFSYTEGAVSKCIFFSQTENPKVIGTISFDSTYNVKMAKANLTERDFTSNEYDIYAIRKIALEEIITDTLFQHYNNTNFNLIPLIKDKVKKVYVLSGPKNSGVVIFGNDYLLTFDANNKLIEKKQLHKNIMPINYSTKEGETNHAVSAVHNHHPDTGDFITATDICTLMLYAKFAHWKTYQVYSEKYFNLWNCETNQLIVVPIKTINKINKDQKKRNKKKEKLKD
jgi:hypothetical protein